MIKVPTVLVLGAGASVPYGFPTGRTLTRIIVESPEWRKRAIWAGVGEEVIKDFVEIFKRSQLYSVDKFLMLQPEYENVGKAAIASVLTEFENSDKLSPNEQGEDNQADHWYQYLWNCLITDWEKFKENKLSIVTFNYDRSLEQYLFQAALHTFHGRRVAECKSLVESIPIIHVYGDLGKLGESDGQNSSRPYRSLPTDAGTLLRELRLAISRIRVVGQRTDSDEHLSKIHGALASAERICFLGFGFEETNLQLLKIERLFQENKLRRFFGSTLGLADAEVVLASSRCKTHKDFFSPQYCMDFLRTHGVLI